MMTDGRSPTPTQTQKGPITISKSIIKLTIAELVKRGAKFKQVNDRGNKSKPIVKTAHIGALNNSSVSAKAKPISPLIKAPIAAAGKISSWGYFLAKVNVIARPIAVNMP